MRRAQRLSAFYATYLFGRIEEREGGSAILFHFGRRSLAEGALWVMRVAGVVLVAGALLAAIQQPIFVLGALLTAVGTGSLLWLYRMRDEDKDRLHQLVTSAASTA